MANLSSVLAQAASDHGERPVVRLARHQVVVIGGGLGGVRVTRALARANVDITIVDRTNHHLFQPLLYQVATGILPAGLIAPALRSVVRKQAHARVVLAEMQQLDLDGRVVHAVPAVPLRRRVQRVVDRRFNRAR